MNLPKVVISLAVLSFGTILLIGVFKPSKSEESSTPQIYNETITIDLQDLASTPTIPTSKEITKESDSTTVVPSPQSNTSLPEANLIHQLFSVNGPKLPIVKTITYSRKAPWLKGRIAWMIDYGHHYKTSRYFISRSLAGKPDYFFESYAVGDRFNIYDPDKEFYFYLLVDISRQNLWLYYIDEHTQERVLLKTYPIGLGRADLSSASGILTPLGKYSFGNKVAIYKPGIMGYFKHEKVEMIRIFGTRWIPFEEALGNNTAPAKGYGIHGTPWDNETTKGLKDKEEGIRGFESDGCIRLKTEDIEEIFAITTDRRSIIEIVKDFFTADIPGKENSTIR